MSNIRQFVGGPTRTQTFTSGTSVVAPTWATGVYVTGCGGGGGGGGINGATSRDSGGGGSAMEVHDLFLNIAGGATITYAIGAAGNAGSVAGGSGGAGGNSTFLIGGVTYTLFGGKGGVGASTATDGAGGAGGDGAGASFGFSPGVGANPTGLIVATLGVRVGPWQCGHGGGARAMFPAMRIGTTGGTAGQGASSSFGIGGSSADDSAAQAGSGFGSGGSGVSNVGSSTARLGGAGAPGFLRFTFLG